MTDPAAPGLDEDSCACADGARTTLGRRRLLQGAAGAMAFAGGGVLADAVMTPTYAAGSDGRVLVVLSQRGGSDGLSIVVPHAEKAYYAARPGIAVPRSRLLAPDVRFGLHPALKPVLPLWKDGRMAALHAVGLHAPNRSHFDALLEVEDADPRGRSRSGWLNRLVAGLSSPAGAMEGVQMGSMLLPASLRGGADTVAMDDPSSLTTPFAGTAQGTAVRAALKTLHGGGSGLAGGPAAAGREALAVVARGATVRSTYAQGVRRGVRYPASPLGQALRASSALIRSGVGVRAITVDSGDWDHHRALTGRLEGSLGDLASSVAAFFADLGPDASRVTLVTLSEFGRRVRQNGAGGLDHGYGNAVLVFGAGVRGGYHARWPGLDADDRVDGDLAVTTDYRHVLAEIVDRRFPEVDRSRVFPDAGRLRPLGFMR